MHGFAVMIPAGSFGDFTGRAILALVLGALIGLERQWRQRMAGLRTNALVALGAALFELFAVLLTGCSLAKNEDTTWPGTRSAMVRPSAPEGQNTGSLCWTRSTQLAPA
jgi:MgtC family